MVDKKIHQIFLFLGLFLDFGLFCQELTPQEVSPEVAQESVQAQDLFCHPVSGSNQSEVKEEQKAVNAEQIDIKDLEKIEKELQKELEQEEADGDESGDGSLDSFLNKVQNPAKMLERLPKETQQVVLTAIEAGRDLMASSQHPTIFLLDILQNLENKIEEILAKNNEQTKELILSLHTSVQAVRNLLNSKDFQLLILFGNQSLKIEKESKEVLEELEKRLVELKNTNLSEKTFLYENVETLRNSMFAIVNGNGDLLAHAREKYIKALSVKTDLILDKAKAELVMLKKSLKEDENKELEESIIFWQEALKGFDSQKPSKLTKIVEVGGKVAPYLEGGYFFYRKFLELYRIDNPIVWSNPLSLLGVMGDQAFRMAMIPVHFLRRSSQLSKAGFDPQMIQAALKQLIAECIGIYMDPNFCVKGFAWPVRSFYRIAPTVAYKGFHDFNKQNFNFKNFFPELEGILEKLPEDEKFRRAVWFSMKDGYQSLAAHLEAQIVRRVNPESLRKIENRSWGLLKPDLISFALNTAMPLLVSSEYCQKHFLNFQKKDVFDNELGTIKDYIANIIGDSYYVGDKDFPSDAYFIEGRIWGYLASNLGSYFGKEIARLNRRPIKFAASKLVKGCSVVLSKLGYIERADWQEQLLKDIRECVQDLLTTDPSMMILVRQGLFPMLAGLGIMSQLEVAKLEDEFNSGTIDDKKIEFVVDKIFSSLADTLIIGVGGIIGSLVAWQSADHLMKKYGPFWPNIKEEGSNAWDAATYGIANLKAKFA